MVKMEENLFWSYQLADKIASRKKMDFVDGQIPAFKKYVVKTSASISGVLHIGRLSDTIRGESVVKSLKDMGKKVDFIWVAEDMDPLRKIPEGVPKEFIKYIGMPVTDIPDPWGCHKSYAEHHVSNYNNVLDQFISTKMLKFSMREEYKKGNFKKFIVKLIDNIEEVRRIQNQFRSVSLRNDWSPWAPICENCGKIITPRVIEFDGKIVHYVCQDYQFEKHIAKGCNFKGENDPLKGEGKLLWKSEWAAQWARWNVACEGAGKEYESRNSAFWINGEICERVLKFPAPVPIFYEHLMIGGVKMSASLGNIVYPKGWLEVSSPQLLRFFYNKKLMKTRSFSWEDLPLLYDDYDYHAKVYFNKIKIENKKQREHMKNLYKISQLKAIQQVNVLPFAHAVLISQIFNNNKDVIKSLKETSHYEEKNKGLILERIKEAKAWAEKYATERYKIKLNERASKIKLNEKQRECLQLLKDALKRKRHDEKELIELFQKIMKKADVEQKEFFSACYLALINKEQGPRLSSLILAIGQEKVIKILS